MDVGVTVAPVNAMPPIVTVAPVAKFVPATVTAVPPAAVPDEGVTLVMVGAAGVGAVTLPPPLLSLPLHAEPANATTNSAERTAFMSRPPDLLACGLQ
jgi:hypothetical protein